MGICRRGTRRPATRARNVCGSAFGATPAPVSSTPLSKSERPGSDRDERRAQEIFRGCRDPDWSRFQGWERCAGWCETSGSPRQAWSASSRRVKLDANS